ncbi:MAG: ABC transporter substrate-binding protein [Bacteroidales bacterium]|nr:ABC transporter substrate-binding protein [Bacteroidales bacterium]
MKKILFLIFSFALFFGCHNSEQTKEKNGKKGGNLRLAIYDVTFDDYIFPTTIANDLEKSLASIFYTGLFQVNPFSLEIENALCKTWEVDNTGSVYVFTIDTTAKFHMNDCFGRAKTRTLTAYDVKYTFHLLANPQYSTLNFTNTVYHIKGAKEYFSLPKEIRDTSRIEGIQVIDNGTLRITLERPSPRFINNLAHPAAAIVPYESVEKYGEKSIVGIGPFRYEADSLEFRFVKCDLYNKFDSQKEKLPYLDSVIIKKTESLDETIDLFVSNQIDAMLLVPSERIAEILAKIPEDMEYEITEGNVANLKGVEKRFNIVRSYIKDLYTNKLGILELESTYNTKKHY